VVLPGEEQKRLRPWQLGGGLYIRGVDCSEESGLLVGVAEMRTLSTLVREIAVEGGF